MSSTISHELYEVRKSDLTFFGESLSENAVNVYIRGLLSDGLLEIFHSYKTLGVHIEETESFLEVLVSHDHLLGHKTGDEIVPIHSPKGIFLNSLDKFCNVIIFNATFSAEVGLNFIKGKISLFTLV